MPEAAAVSPGLVQRLADMQDRLAAVQAEAEPPLAALHLALVAQLQDMADFIATARREIASMQVNDILGLHLPTASDELDAIIVHTAEATGLILDECETLEGAVQGSPLRATVTAATARVYEACSFQDITGQRIAKVVHTLKLIDAKVGDMLGVFGSLPSVATVPHHTVALLNGPQHSGLALEQHDIDALLASFE